VAKQPSAKAPVSPAPKAFKPALLLVLLLPAAALMAPIAIVMVAALVPSVVARIVDASPNRYLTFTVLGLNLVGSLYFVHQVLTLGNDLEVVARVLQDSIGWLAALSGAGCGWLLYIAVPPLIAKMAEAQSALRLRRVHKDQTQLINEWGEVVAARD
jgi:membrane associated rhomboid family serine protease